MAEFMQPWGGTWIPLSLTDVDTFMRGGCVVLERPAVRIAEPLNEVNQPDRDAHGMCGATWLAWGLQCVGIDVSPEEVETWLRATYSETDVAGGVNGAQLVAASQHFGCPAHVSNDPPSVLFAANPALPLGCCVWCTPYAVPCTEKTSLADSPNGLGHWLGPEPVINVALVSPQENDDMPDLAILTRKDGGPDPLGPDAIYLAEVVRRPGKDPIPVRKRHIATPADVQTYVNAGIAEEQCAGYLLDRAEMGPPVAGGVYPTEQ